MSMDDALDTEVLRTLTPSALIARAVELLDEEREVFLTGQYEKLPRILAFKSALLEQIEQIILSAARSAVFVSAVKKLIEASRRNEQIIRAAQQGLSHARRRLKAIDDMKDGVVAYSADGNRITSRADQIRDRSSA